MPLKSVLISSSGRRVELWRLFESAIRELGLSWRVIGADSNPSCATALAAGPVHEVPRVDDAHYSQAIHQLIADERVGLIVPTIDTELAYYARLQVPGVVIAASGPHAVALTSDKLSTFGWATEQGIATAPTIPLYDAVPEMYRRWVVKPRRGSSSVGLQVGLKPTQLAAYRENLPVEAHQDWIAQPCLEGPEFTVNCFVEPNGVCSYAVPHLRVVTRAGEVSHAVTTHDSAIEDLVRRAMGALPDASGPLCAQVIRDRELGPVLIEINARFGGGYPVAHEAGARGPHRLLRQAADLPIDQTADAWEAGVEMVRFDQSVFRRHASNPIDASTLPTSA